MVNWSLGDSSKIHLVKVLMCFVFWEYKRFSEFSAALAKGDTGRFILIWLLILATGTNFRGFRFR